MKNSIVGGITVIVVGLMAYTLSQGRAFQGGESNKIIENIAPQTNSVSFNSDASQGVKQPTQEESEAQKLKALKEKAGNVATFKVSDNFKRKCASCHGIDGKGAVGLPLFRQSGDVLFAKVLEYKNGTRTNPIMKGAVLNLSESDLKELAYEIGEFKARELAASK